VLRSRIGRPSSKPALSTTTDWTASKTVADVLAILDDKASRYVARAPGRLDVMGGIAEYTGGLVLQLPTGEHVYACAQERTDGKLRVHLVGDDTTPGKADPLTLELPEPADPGAGFAPLQNEDPARAGRLAANREGTLACVQGVVTELRARSSMEATKGGLSIVIGSTMKSGRAAGYESALCAATAGAAGKLWRIELDWPEAARLCQRVENRWLGAPVGIAGATCSLVGEPYTVGRLSCETDALGPAVKLPDDLLILGVDCGTVSKNAAQKYTAVRVAAAMGRVLIARIRRHQSGSDEALNHPLAGISRDEFVDNYRDRLPTKISGRDFLERFGETGDPLTRVDPNSIYKVRSRTEHHIYENDRALRFADSLADGAKESADIHWGEAGELMYASHWSYGQRCGLGSAQTELLISLIRRYGAEVPIYGARSSGRGCGGVVVVMMRDTPETRSGLDAAIEDYESQSGLSARLIQGSAEGVLVGGVNVLPPHQEPTSVVDTQVK